MATATQVNETSSRATGVIIGDGIYKMSEVCRLLGWGRSAWKSARKQGLRVTRRLGRSYVLGKDLLRFFSSDDAA